MNSKIVISRQMYVVVLIGLARIVCYATKATQSRLDIARHLSGLHNISTRLYRSLSCVHVLGQQLSARPESAKAIASVTPVFGYCYLSIRSINYPTSDSIPTDTSLVHVYYTHYTVYRIIGCNYSVTGGLLGVYDEYMWSLTIIPGPRVFRGQTRCTDLGTETRVRWRVPGRCYEVTRKYSTVIYWNR